MLALVKPDHFLVERDPETHGLVDDHRHNVGDAETKGEHRTGGQKLLAKQR